MAEPPAASPVAPAPARSLPEDRLQALTTALRARAHRYELERAWPRESLADYARLGGWRWGIPRAHGGAALDAAERLRGYAALARGDMSTALFVTQHEGAVDLVVASANEPLRRRWLPRFAAGEALTTIGYSQLTTSRQGGAPALRARPAGGGFVLDGVMPWVTGAPHVGTVACGAQLPDGTQVLGLLPLDAPGVTVRAAAELAALNSTHTCEVRCRAVRLPAAAVIRGPVAHVLSERTPLRLLLVSATGVGLAHGMVDALAEAAACPPPLAAPGGWEPRLARARAACSNLERALLECAAGERLDQAAIDRLRVDVNERLLKLAGVLMTAAKGSGYRAVSPAQRLAREALFFCVWSASDSVRAGTADALGE